MHAFTLMDMLRDAALRAPDRIAVKDEKETITYARLLERVESVAQTLIRHGLRRGDRVGVCKENSVASVIALLSVVWCGGVFVALNVNLKRRQIDAIAEDCGIRLMLTDHVRLRYLFAGEPTSYALVDMDVEIKGAPHATPPDSRLTDRDLACLIYTSGSTGKAKGVMFTHNDVLKNARIISRLLHTSPEDSILCVLPFSADYGLTLLFISLLNTSRLVLVSNFLPNDVVNALLSEKITSFHAITEMWPMLFGRTSLFPGKSYPHLRQISIGGGYPPQGIQSRIVEMFHPGVEIFMLYGLTEANWTAALLPADLVSRAGSLGMALPDVEMLLIDEKGQLLDGPGEGELVHRGGVVAQGYWNDPVKTAQVFRNIADVLPRAPVKEEKVVFTGDWVRRDERGFYAFIARKDDQIKVRGFRINSEDVVDCLHASQVVETACIFGVPDEQTGQRIIACVVPRAGADKVKETLGEVLRRELPAYSVPAELFLLREMPLTPSFKQDVKRLRQHHLDGTLVDDMSFTPSA